MNQPRITAKITLRSAAEGGRDVFPANLGSGQYRPHIVIDPHHLKAAGKQSVQEETYLGVIFESGPAQVIPGQPFFRGPCVDVLARH